MTNKTRLAEGTKILALIIWAMCTIATCARLWNAAAEIKIGGFYIVTSIVLLLTNLFVIGYCGKKVWGNYGKLSIEESKK